MRESASLLALVLCKCIAYWVLRHPLLIVFWEDVDIFSSRVDGLISHHFLIWDQTTSSNMSGLDSIGDHLRGEDIHVLLDPVDHALVNPLPEVLLAVGATVLFDVVVTGA